MSIDLEFSTIITIERGPTRTSRTVRGDRTWRDSVSFAVDSVEGDEVRLRCASTALYEKWPEWFTASKEALTTLLEIGAAKAVKASASPIAPPGECTYCDKQRESESTFFPRHTASDRCRSGHRNHCTCDTCF